MRDQILAEGTDGYGNTLTRERLLALSHGVVRNEDQRSVASEERGSDYMMNPIRWENNAARKQLDMQWNFTCGPLRVSRHAGPSHWNRLHSDNVAAIPQPGGGVHVMTSSIPHRSDAELEQEAAKMGYSHRARLRSQLPPLPPPNPPSTPMLRQMLKDSSVAPLPRRPTSIANRSMVTDASSAFSRTTVAASKASTAKGSKVSAAGAKSQLRTASSADGSSVVGHAKEGKVATASAVGKASAVSRGSRATGVSNASRRSEAESIRVDVERERTKQRDLAAELRDAARRLEALESLLEEEK